MAPTVLRPEFQHLLPLCASSISVGLSIFSVPLFLAFLQSRPSIAGRPLSQFWYTPSCPFPYGILVPLATQALSGLWAARSLQGTTSTTLLQGSTTAATWYAYGVAASVAHMLFAPLTIPHVKEITRGAPDVDDDHNIKHEVSWEEEQKVEERNRNAQGKWLWVHVLRTVVADVPAMVFFAKGFGEAFM